MSSDKNIHRKKSPDLIMPVLFILLGGLLLLQNLGLIPWEIWREMWQFWPILLIASGIQLTIGKRKHATLIVSSFIVLSFIGILLFSLSQIRPQKSFFRLPRLFSSSESNVTRKRTDTISQNAYDLSEIEAITYLFDVSASKLQLTDSDSNDFLSLKSQLPPQLKPEVGDRLDNNKLDILVKQKQPWYQLSTDTSIYSNLSTHGIPTNIRIDLGAGSALLELDELKFETLMVNVGAGSSVLDLSQMSTPSGTVKLDVGVGSAQVILPKDVEFDLKYEVGIGKVSLNQEDLHSGMGISGSYNQSEDIDSQPELKFDINVGTGSVELIQPKADQ